MTKVATFSEIRDEQKEKRNCSALGCSIDNMEKDYREFKKSRRNK